MAYVPYSVAFDKVADKYSAEYAVKLHTSQLYAVYYSIIRREEDIKLKQKLYKETQLCLFV